MPTHTTLRPTGVYRLSHLARQLGVSLRTLQRAVEGGRLVATRAGRYTFTTGRCVLNWLERRSKPSPESEDDEDEQD